VPKSKNISIGVGARRSRFRREYGIDQDYHAAMLDRPAASMLLLDEMVDMVDELIEAHGEAMPKGVRSAARKPPR
jgi:alpha-galactosidase